MGHPEVAVKVNAWVDEGIAGLVNALNAVPGVLTLSGCQDSPDGVAYVDFTTHAATPLDDTVRAIATALARMAECPAVLSLRWCFGGEQPAARIECPPGAVQMVAEGLSRGARMMVLPGGNRGTEPHSSTARRDHQHSPPLRGGTQPTSV
jgi:hypothetical protein